jgi:3-dehydroquinate dehydratase type II
MRILIVNGPNLNLIGTRRPDIYGTTTIEELDEECRHWGADLGAAVETFQSNHEGELIDRLQAARHDFDAIVINPGALTHYSYALRDAIEAIDLPTVEVHISNIKAREPWRRHSVVSSVCVTTIYGRGVEGYQAAIRHLVARSEWPVETIAYGEEPDQVGDLRLPDGPGPHPVAVIIHGGFWRDPWRRDLMDAVAVALTDRGWATWNIEYRRVGGGGGWPSTLEDVGAAMDVLATFGAGHGLDLGRVVTIGHSAGGHLALWAAARRQLPAGSPGGRPTVVPVAAVGLAPVPDLKAAHRLGLGSDAVEAFLRRSPEAGDGRYATSSPAQLLPIGAQILLIHGDADEAVPAAMSREFAGRAADAGDPVILRELEDVDHRSLIEPRSAAWQRVVGEIDALSRREPEAG